MRSAMDRIESRCKALYRAVPSVRHTHRHLGARSARGSRWCDARRATANRMKVTMNPLMKRRAPDRNAGRDDDLDRSRPSPMLRIVAIIVIVAMVLSSASVIIARTDVGTGTGLLIFAVLTVIAGLLVWAWNRQGRTADDDLMGAGS